MKVESSKKVGQATKVGQAFLPAQADQVTAQAGMPAPHCAYPKKKVGQAFLPAQADQVTAQAGMPAPPFPAPAFTSPVAITQRRLPHWHMEGAIYWVCFRLADSIPLDKLQAWKEERAAWTRVNPEPWDERQWLEYDQLFGDRLDAWLDAGMGSRALARPDARDAVADCLLRFDGDRLLIHAAVIMPTHVHALIEPLPVKRAGGRQGEAGLPACPDGECAGRNACATLQCHDFSDLLQGIKGASARLANRLLGTTGNAFWMDESYDHIVRSESQYRHFLRYIQENPVKAGLQSDEFWMTVGHPQKVGQAFLPALLDETAQAGMPAPPLRHLSPAPPSRAERQADEH